MAKPLGAVVHTCSLKPKPQDLRTPLMLAAVPRFLETNHARVEHGHAAAHASEANDRRAWQAGGRVEFEDPGCRA